MARSIIDERGLGPRVLTMAAGGVGSRQIAQMLEGEGIKLSHVAIYKYLQVHIGDHREATEQVKAAVQAELQRHALNDVQLLEKLRDELARVVFDEPPPIVTVHGVIPGTVDRSLWLKATKELRDTLGMRLSKAGAGDDDNALRVRVDIL